MFQRLYEFSRCLPQKPDWERLNEGLPANYDRGIAICLENRGVRHDHQTGQSQISPALVSST